MLIINLGPIHFRISRDISSVHHSYEWDELSKFPAKTVKFMVFTILTKDTYYVALNYSHKVRMGSFIIR